MSTEQKLQFKAASQTAEAAGAAISPSPLIKTWTNIDPATRDIVKIVIAASGTAISVEAFGACSPTPCDWGSVPGLIYAANVSASKAVAFSAGYTFSFATVILVGHHAGKHLVVESFTQFTDGSGRSNFRSTDTFD
jgi:hypothetical protein